MVVIDLIKMSAGLLLTCCFILFSYYPFYKHEVICIVSSFLIGIMLSFIIAQKIVFKVLNDMDTQDICLLLLSISGYAFKRMKKTTVAFTTERACEIEEFAKKHGFDCTRTDNKISFKIEAH